MLVISAPFPGANVASEMPCVPLRPAVCAPNLCYLNILMISACVSRNRFMPPISCDAWTPAKP